MAPMADRVGILIEYCHFNEPHSPVHQFSDLVAQLSRRVVDIEYKLDRQPIIVDQQLNGLRNIVYASFAYTNDSEQIMQLAKSNASTLQVLKISLMSIIDIIGLLQDADGSYMQYPCLQTFRLRGPRGLDIPRQLTFPGAVPFPCLQHLEIGYMNPFGDDTVFRGNAATLETLSLSSSPGMARIIWEYRGFTPVSHPKLWRVRLGLELDYEPDIFETDVEYMRFVLSIGANAPMSTVFGLFAGTVFQTVIPVIGEYTCIQVLVLGSLYLNLWDAIALI
ncbi:hypothetical protein GGI17_004130 [Coemansia sp. S146]|nr:hypothetical protein GGI17_004130 [Coemansia sp. S146]